MGFMEALLYKGDKSTVLRFYLEETDSEELTRCRKREPVVFRRHPAQEARVLVFHKRGQGAEARLGAVPEKEAKHVADHLWRGYFCEGSILELKGGTCRVKCRLIGL